MSNDPHSSPFVRRTVHGIDLTAPGGLDALFAHHRAHWGGLTMNANDDGANGDDGQGGDGGGDGGGDNGGQEPPKADNDKLGFPKDTPVADMTDPQKVAYWEHHAKKHEKAWKKIVDDVTPEKFAADMAELKQYRDAQLTDGEKAVREAREQGKAEARTEANEAVIKALVSVRMPEGKEVKDFPALEALDFTKFIDSEGGVDTDRVAAVLDQIVGAPGKGSDDTPRWPNLGQGRRGNEPKSGRDAGQAEAERRGFIKTSS